MIKLVTPPTISDEIKEGVVKLARKVLEDAEAGNCLALLVIAERPDGTWSREWSGTENFSISIGRLMISIHEWIAQYARLYGGQT